MTTYFNLLSAKKSSDAKDMVILVDVETAKECPFAISFLAKQTGIDLSNYFKAVTTDTPIVDDLPEENEFSTTWCEKYELADDKKTWRLIADEEAPQPEVELINISTRPLDFRFSSLWLFGPETETITREQMKDVIDMIADTGDNFAQNILLCVRGEQFAKDATLQQLGALAQATKDVFMYTDRPAELGQISNFIKQYCSCAISDAGEGALANIVTLYRSKQTTPVMPETKAQTTSTGATLGTPIRLSDDVLHSPVFLKKVIAYALQPANGYDLLSPPKTVIDRAAELMTDQDVTDWYNALSETPGILALHPDFTFACIQAAPIAITSDKGKLREYISNNLGVIQPVPIKAEETASNEGENQKVGTTDTTTEESTEHKTVFSLDALLAGPDEDTTEKTELESIASIKPILSPRAERIKLELQHVIAGKTKLISADAIANLFIRANVNPDDLIEWLPNEIELAEFGEEIDDPEIGSLMLDLFDVAPAFIADSSARVQFFTEQIALYKKEWEESASKVELTKRKTVTIEELQSRIDQLEARNAKFDLLISAAVDFLSDIAGRK